MKQDIARQSKTSLRKEAAFFSHLSLMFQAGVPLNKALEILAGTEESSFSQVILSVLGKLESGFGLTQAFKAQGEAFSPISLTLLSTGEQSGSLGPCLSLASAWAERAANYRAKLLQAIIYPAMILLVNGLMTLLFLIWLVPAFENMVDVDSAPLLTKLVFGASRWLRVPGFWLGLLPLLWLVLHTLRRLRKSQRLLSYIALIPGLGHLLREVQRARYWTVFSSLHLAGSPFLRNLELAAQATQSASFLKSYQELKREVLEGGEISAHFQSHRRLYGSVLMSGLLLLTDGQGGKKLCESLTHHFQVEIESRVDQFHILVEPILITLVAVSTSLLLLGLYLPFARFLQELLAV